MTTILAPWSLRALSRNGQPCRFVLVMFMPHTMMYFEYAIDSMSRPPEPPTVMCHAVEEPDSQYVFSATVAPSRLKNASPAVSPLSTPWWPR